MATPKQASPSPEFVKPTPITTPHEQNPLPNLSPIQKLVASALDKIEKSLIIESEKNQKLPKTVDLAIQIYGNFAPVRHDLQVVGQILVGLQGVYLRNGANLMFSPTGGHHLFDGDEMIHVVTLGSDNKASYSCRFTQTSRLTQEAALGGHYSPSQSASCTAIPELLGSHCFTRAA